MKSKKSSETQETLSLITSNKMGFHQFSLFLGKNGDLGSKYENEVNAFEEEPLFFEEEWRCNHLRASEEEKEGKGRN